MGEMLKETERAKGAKGKGINQYTKEVQFPDVTAPVPTLSSLGLTKRESAEAQLLASALLDAEARVRELLSRLHRIPLSVK